jgi:hypothetical protein
MISKRIILIIILMLSTAGCAFVGYGGIGEAVYTSREQKRPVFRYNMLNSDLSKRDKKVTDTTPFQVSDIEAEWGKPDEIVVNDTFKKMTYKKGLRWKGIILIIGIPVPIAVPVGHKTITFNFENDFLNYWTILDDHYCVSYAGFNLIPLDPEGKTFGLKAETSCKWHKDMTPYDGKMACAVPLHDRCYPSPDYGRGDNLK